jgi:hypothetical protein
MAVEQAGEMSVRLMRELLHKYQNPHHFNDHDIDEEGAVGISVPRRIPSKIGTVQRAQKHLHGESSKKLVTNLINNINNNNNNNNVNNSSNDSQLSPPDTLPSEMSLSSYMDAQWDRSLRAVSHSSNNYSHQHGCSRKTPTTEDMSMEPSTSSSSSSMQPSEESPKRHNSMDRLVGMFNDLEGASNRQRSLSDSEQQQPDILNNLNNTPPIPPKRKHRHRSPSFQQPIANGLPPTPKVRIFIITLIFM